MKIVTIYKQCLLSVKIILSTANWQGKIDKNKINDKLNGEKFMHCGCLSNYEKNKNNMQIAPFGMFWVKQMILNANM